MTFCVRKYLLFALFVPVSWVVYANKNEQKVDTLIAVDRVQITAIKQGSELRREAVAASVLGGRTLEMQGVSAVKDVMTDVPNLFMPDYGSRTTSSIYVRGMGTRIDQPVVGMNVDNVPLADKNLYDTELPDIERIEFLRGPQATLYGRNTMGGVINVYTLSPLTYQGVRLRADYGSRNSFRVAASSYNRFKEKFGFSVSAQYAHCDGYWRNSYDNSLCDKENSGNFRTKFQYREGALSIDNTLAFSMVEQGGYPYQYIGSPNPDKHREELVGKICYNEPCSYARLAVNDGLSIRYDFGKFSLASITSYQYMNDKMHIDNDFLPEYYFTLEQRKQQHHIAEDFVLRSKEEGVYRWLVGVNGFFKREKMQAPVTFGATGIKKLILDNINANSGYDGEYRWGDTEGNGADMLLLDSRFLTHNSGVAAYHRSEVHLGRWRMALGLRLDYELVQMIYNTNTDTAYTMFSNSGESTVCPIHIANSELLTRGFLEFLPSFSVSVDLDDVGRNMLYLSASKGYKAGGFNTQMFSEVLQRELQKKMGLHREVDIEALCAYNPEHSYNLELGGHFGTRDGVFTADASLFYIECLDQQLTIFPDENSTGRMMTNAGRTRSFGAEISATARLAKTLVLRGSYGYTNAKFRQFVSGGVDYAGNYIPYAPKNSLSLRLMQTVPFVSRWIDRMVLSVGVTGAGRIYWNEANDVSQPLYALLDASVRFEGQKWAVDFWCKNATNTRYDLFYFESMGNRFLQRGRPVSGGVRVVINIL
ncbi:MAG: TonB-dependent receptor [Rikenellaceae bacterium]|nr:TonB-dependent receptor [Rikenellaceae bacterium]